MFRLLTAGEIECRVAQAGKSGDKVWCSILIYKDARVDQRVLDETVGPMNWKTDYCIIDGNLYCVVSIWDKEKNQWIPKQNVGVESNTEKEKGQASDALKRACFTWGLGVELYTAPKIFINLEKGEFKEDNGRIKCSASFYVRSIEYGPDRNITGLVIIDRNGKVRYDMNAGEKATKTKTYTSADGRTLSEGSKAWKIAAKRVASGETCEDGTPIAIKMQEYYNIPDEAMKRFFELVNELKANAPIPKDAVSPSYEELVNP